MRNNSKQVVKTKVVISTTKKQTTSKSASKPESKPALKAPSQVPTKKVEVQKVVVHSDVDEIKDTFKLINSNRDGRIKSREIRSEMQGIGFDEKKPNYL